MGKALGLAVALFLLAAPAVEAAPGPSGKLRAGAEETVLRLHDLPPGYVIEGDGGCAAFQPTEIDDLRALDRWITRYGPVGCEFEYERRFSVPGYGPTPPRVLAETINTPSARAAADGFAMYSRLISFLAKRSKKGTLSLGPGGPTATLFRFKVGFKDSPKLASLLFWEHGKLLAAVEVSGMTPRENDSAALHYAQAQQRRLESPSPYTEAERDDTEVELDDPNLKLPVYWLGRTFEPANGLPPVELQSAHVVEEPGLPGSKLELTYGGWFSLETWTQPGWRRFKGSFLGKLNRPPCTRTVAFEWEGGHGVISAGYRRRTFEKGCPDHPPTRYWAVAHIGGVVVGVNQTICRCLSPGSGPYSESLQGMKAILRGLTLRPKPAF